MTLNEAFTAISHAFPIVAEFQGRHFTYAEKNGVMLIENKKTVFTPHGECSTCGQHRGEKQTRYFYWLTYGGRFHLVHASLKSRLSPMKTIGESLPPLAQLTP